jgi:hypothetical protein
MELFTGLLCISILFTALVDCWFKRNAPIFHPLRITVGLLAAPTGIPFLLVCHCIARIRYGRLCCDQ